MNSIEKYIGNKEEFYFFLKDEVIKLFKDKLKIDGTRVLIPENQELEYKFKLVKKDNYGNFSIEVKWGLNQDESKDIKEELDEDIEVDIQEDSGMVIDKYVTMKNS